MHAGNKTILTTGRDNTLRLYNQGMLQQCTVSHNNNTGRWVMPLRATLGPSDTIICGSMKRAVRPPQHVFPLAVVLLQSALPSCALSSLRAQALLGHHGSPQSPASNPCCWACLQGNKRCAVCDGLHYPDY